MGSPMAVTIAVDGLGLDASDLSGINSGEKRKHDVVGSGEGQRREHKLRSRAWDHFTKLMKEDGTYEKSQCNHCQKLFSYNSRSGTTHMLRHITDGHCSSYNNKQEIDFKPKNGTTASWKFEDVVLNHSGQEQFGLPDGLLQSGLVDLEGGYGGQAPAPAPEKTPKRKYRRGGEEAWMKELSACVNKLIVLTNEKLPNGMKNSPVSAAAADSVPQDYNSPASAAASVLQDYSIGNAVRFLNEMEDIPASSEMYLDAVDLLRDDGERECFVCLPSEARRRWLQRSLHRCHPMRYLCNF